MVSATGHELSSIYSSFSVEHIFEQISANGNKQPCRSS